MTKDIHDLGYKKLFSNKIIFRQLLETFVKEDWVQYADFDNCETVDKTFVDELYSKKESDLIYKLKLKDKEIFIYILIEFQSSVDKFISLRILNYITRFYMNWVETEKKKYLPAIFPIMIYNGKKKWTSPVNVSDLIKGNDILGKYGLNFEYFKIVEHEYTKETLLKIRNIVSTLFLAETHYDFDLIINEIEEIFDKEEDKTGISILVNWFKQLAINGKIDDKDFEELEKVYRNKEDIKLMLIDAIKKEKQDIFLEGKFEGELIGIQKGKVEGEQIGIQKGKLKSRKELLLKLLYKKFKEIPSDIINKINSIESIDTIDTIVENIFELQNLSDILDLL